MFFILFFACFSHKTSLTGIIDNVGRKKCVVELNTGELIIIESTLCKTYREGDKIIFYGRKE